MKKHCKRKHYPLVNTILMATEGAAITPDNLLDKLRLLELSAIEAFTHGKATIDDWKTMADTLNVCETMATGGVGREALEACDRAQQGLDEARERHARTGQMGLSGPGIQAMRDVAQYMDLQRQSISRGEYERWIIKTRDRIRSAHPNVKAYVA